MNNYKTIKNNSEFILIEKKSKFIGNSFLVSSDEEVKNILKALKKEHYSATHNCFAYRLFNKNEKQSDDGEPSGTAGLPILNVLKKEDLYNVLIVVTRYYGGIQLGTGGLTRAYSQSAKGSVIDNIITKKMYKEIIIELDYTYINLFTKLCESNNAIIHDTKFLEKVEFGIHILNDEIVINNFERNLSEMTNGNFKLIKGNNLYI